MEFSIRKVSGLIKKDFKDLLRNINILFMCIIPILLCFIYSAMIVKNSGENLSKLFALNQCVNINVTIICGFIIAMLIAEEKEKNTMRTLFLSGISPLEFLTGKAFITILITIAINIVMFFILKMDLHYLYKFIIVSTLVALSMIILGALVGLLSQNQMATGTIGTPIFMAIYIIPIFANKNYIINKISSLIPTYNLDILMERIFTGKVLNFNFFYNIIVIIAWIIILALVFVYSYIKKGLDR